MLQNTFIALQPQISCIKALEWGSNISTEGLDQGHHDVFLLTFATTEDLHDTYLPHPAHVAFVELFKPHVDNVLVLDYWTAQ